jgi:hypothetical protein
MPGSGAPCSRFPLGLGLCFRFIPTGKGGRALDSWRTRKKGFTKRGKNVVSVPKRFARFSILFAPSPYLTDQLTYPALAASARLYFPSSPLTRGLTNFFPAFPVSASNASRALGLSQVSTRRSCSNLPSLTVALYTTHSLEF